MPHRMAFGVVLFEVRLLGIVAGAFLVGEVHRPLGLPRLLVPVRTPTARAWLAGRVLLPGQRRDLAPHGITDPLALLLRSLGLPGQLEGRVQVPSPLVFRQFRHASTVSLRDPNSYHRHRNKQLTFHADIRLAQERYRDFLVERNDTIPQLAAAPVR